jgi:hypothetical protein
MTKVKLYIGCALFNAPETFVQQIAALKDSLRAEYEILDFAWPPPKSMAHVYRWDIEHCVRSCDLFVAICNEPSLGLGWELCEAVHLGTPILAVAHTDAKVSGLVRGAAEVKSNMTFVRYNDLPKELPGLIKKHVKALPATTGT